MTPTNNGREFRPEELEIARALAIQASLAIQLTRLAKGARQSAVLEERNELAGEIHDSLAQLFTGISMQLGVARKVIKRGAKTACLTWNEQLSWRKFGLSEARRTAFSLQPTLIEESGLIAALQNWSSVEISQAGCTVISNQRVYPKKACRPLSSKISFKLLRKRLATRFAMPSRLSSALVFALDGAMVGHASLLGASGSCLNGAIGRGRRRREGCRLCRL